MSHQPSAISCQLLIAESGKLKANKGFLLMEALILILILSVAFVSFIGVVSQALKVSSKTRGVTQALADYEMLAFELDSGLRPDLAKYGGRGELENGYQYDLKSEESEDLYGLTQSHLSWKEGKDFLDFDLFISQGALE